MLACRICPLPTSKSKEPARFVMRQVRSTCPCTPPAFLHTHTRTDKHIDAEERRRKRGARPVVCSQEALVQTDGDAPNGVTCRPLLCQRVRADVPRECRVRVAAEIQK